MTTLTKPVTRHVYDRGSGDLVVTLTAAGIVIREKGRRTSYGPLGYGALLTLGARAYADEQRAARKAARRRL